MRFHCTAVAAAAFALAAGGAAAQEAAPAADGNAVFAIYLRGTQIGREQVSVATAASGRIITSSGATATPLDFTIARFEIKYSPDWQPLELTLEGHTGTTALLLRTSFTLTNAINAVTQNRRTTSKEDPISAKTGKESIVAANSATNPSSARLICRRKW